jgi:transposase
MLTDKQFLALQSLLLGDTALQAAAKAGVDRRTVTRWKQQPAFQAELNRFQRLIAGKIRAEIAALADDAVAAIAYRIERDDTPTAVELLTSQQVLDGKPLTELEANYVNTTPDPAAPFTQLVACASPDETNSTPEGFVGPLPYLQPPGAALAAADSAKPQTLGESLNLSDLPIRQQLAICEFLAGRDLAAAATKAQVSLFTMQRWLHCDQAFRQVLRDCRTEQMYCLQTKLLNMSGAAVQILRRALNIKHDRRVAFAVLRGIAAVK